ncbi:plasminogen-like [Argopecten irradians]|uniref:plasminogen-like n=1 Tax=Argopecten irradians TaxID=31199 RepID=UPI0037239E21
MIISLIAECPLPDLKGYTLQRTYAGGRAMRKYRCVEFTDPEVVDNCPVVKCNQRITDKPASCSVKDIFSSSTRHYEGGVTCTVKGVTCQRWDTDFPHGHNQLSGRSDLGNRCQIDGETRPWCYTTDPEIRWDYCPVEELPSCPPPPDIEHDTIKINTIWRYADTALYKCSSNTTEEPVSSCPVSTCVHSTQTWTTANVSCSGTDCYNATSHTYHGRVSCTENGIPCQRWDSNMPHVPGHFHGRSDLENWCQMTEELNKPWCYTKDPSTLYSFCPVDPCT